jgi:hypothetical protein
VLATLALANVMALLDLFVVNVALHDIGVGLHYQSSLSDVAWVLNAYALIFGALLIPAGRFADKYGRKATFILGLAVFTIASLACAVSPDLWVLVGFRCVQARKTPLIGGGGTVGSLAARTSMSTNVLVVSACIRSRPGAALLNVGPCSAESPETRHCHRPSLTFGLPTRRSAWYPSRWPALCSSVSPLPPGLPDGSPDAPSPSNQTPASW